MSVNIMELSKLKNSDLNEKVKNLVAQERRLTKIILEHIAEVDQRKLFLSMAYPSLFEYLTKEIGYSAGAAQRRIDAARLLQRVPEVSNQIDNGRINLAQISKLQKACRIVKKESGTTVSADLQKNILIKLENKGSEQTDIILAKEFNIEIKTEEKKHTQRDESVRIEFTFSKEEMELLKKAQELLSHKTGGNLKNTVLEMAQKTVISSELKKSKVGSHAAAGSTATVAAKSVTPKLKREILNRDQVCQYKNKETGKICGSKHFLEIDHIQPKFAQGNNEVKNLRALCKNHNIYRYQTGL